VKLRIHGNSLRLRLDSSEIEQLQNVGHCSNSLQFGPDVKLTYSIETSPQVKTINAQYGQDCIRITLPHDLARDWAASDQVSLSVDRSDGAGLSVLIEKDLPCRHGEGKISNAFSEHLASRADE